MESSFYREMTELFPRTKGKKKKKIKLNRRYLENIFLTLTLLLDVQERLVAQKGLRSVISNTDIVCFIPSVHFSDFSYVNNRLWFEIYGNR